MGQIGSGGNMISAQTRVDQNFATAQLWTARALRDFPSLRESDMKLKLMYKVWELSQEKINPETIFRAARKLRQKGLYLPKHDHRLEFEEAHRRLHNDTS